MSRNNTGNPIGSKAFPDFEDNVKNLDQAVNAEQDTFQDRLGKSRLTWAGMESGFGAGQVSREQRFLSAQSYREAAFSDFLQASGYQDLGEYAPGIEITAHNQYVTFGGQPYLLKPSIPVPYTTSGGWTGDDFKLIGDDALRQDLASGTAIAVNRTLKQIVEQAYSLGAVTVASSNSSSDVKAYATYVCDGADDHIEINAALAAHPRVVLTDGTYFLGGTVQPQSNTALIGQGKDRTKLELVLGLSASGVPVVMNSDISNVILKGFTIDGNGDQQGFTGNPEGLRLSTGQNFYISDVRVFNINHHALEISFGFENAIFEDCEFDYCSGDTLEVEFAENVYFYRCKFSRAGSFPHPTHPVSAASNIEFEQENKNIRFIDCKFDGANNRAMLFESEDLIETLAEDIYFTRCDFDNIRLLCQFSRPTSGVYFSDCRIKGNNAEGSVVFTHFQDAHDIVFHNCRISDFRETSHTTRGDLFVNLYDTDLINVGNVRAQNQGDLKWYMRGGSISYNPDGFFNTNQKGFFRVEAFGASQYTDFANAVTEITLHDVEVSDLTCPLITPGTKYKFIASNLRFKNVLMTGSALENAVLNFNLTDSAYASDMDIYVDIKGFTIEGDAELGVVFGHTLKDNRSSGSVQIRLDNWDFQNTLIPFRNGDISGMGSNLALGSGLGFEFELKNAGVATITNGTTNVVLNHADTFPFEVQDADIQVTANGPLGNATYFWATKYGSTTWRIYLDKDPGQDVQFSWRLMRIQPYQP